MNKTIITIFLVTVLVGCSNQSKKEELNNETNILKNTSLEYIDEWNQIELAHTDDKYGEWGGDSDIILIYSDGKNLYANYSKYLGSRKPPAPPDLNKKPKKWYEYKKLDFKIDSIIIDKNKTDLVENAILELVKQKVYNSTSFSHSGIKNSVITRDSSLIINDFPSNKWLTFQKLKNFLIKK
ncbi:hypothetical protein V5097_22480 [Arenibacter palladensis]|uniref:hypothetical protein n=1 Tax=Arenibacter palladensis TaxID=237373 RepID=UPI002FD32DFF